MNLIWPSSNYIIDKYFDLDKSTAKKTTVDTFKWSIEKVITSIQKRFPTPNKWLDASLRDKFANAHQYSGFDDYHYILIWLWESKAFNINEFKGPILEYILHTNNLYKKSPRIICTKLNLILPNEIEVINSVIISTVCIHCLLLGKPFREFSDDDIGLIPELMDRAGYTLKIVQDIRIKLGYSSKIIRPKRPSYWDSLSKDPVIGSSIKEYRDFLIRCNAKPRYIHGQITPIRKLYDFVQSKGYNNFSNITAKDLVEYTDSIIKETSIVTASQYIPKLKHFFGWGVGEDKNFPDSLKYPDTYWKSIQKKAKQISLQSESRAFSEPDLADNIMKIILEYVPQNDTESVCRSFWLILGSCTTRFSFILELEASTSLQPLPNAPDTLAIYSRFADKAGNQYGQFPILDTIGIGEVKSLQDRAKKLNLNPITNPKNNDTYVHLFQLQEYPWILQPSIANRFFNDVVEPKLKEIYSNSDEIKTYAHGFRHHLLTHIAVETGDIEVVQTAAGHKDPKMTKRYLRSKISKRALLFRVMDKFENQEITGNFYLRLVDLLSNENSEIDEIFTALSSEMTIDQFIQQYGKRMDIGYCFNTAECSNWLKCWSCINFMITKEEINAAINTLARIIFNIRKAQKTCTDFSFEHPMINTQIKTISLIIKRLNELGITEEQIVTMFNNLIHDNELIQGVNK